MAASGLPIRNRNAHSDVVCTMALEVLAAVVGGAAFRIPHLRYDQLLVRIGIHTGELLAAYGPSVHDTVKPPSPISM